MAYVIAAPAYTVIQYEKPLMINIKDENLRKEFEVSVKAGDIVECKKVIIDYINRDV